MAERQRILNAPPVVVWLLVLLILIHAGTNLVGEDGERLLLLALAFIPARYGPFGSEISGSPWAELTSPVTHMFLHGDVAHLLVNGAWLLAVGTVAARRVGPLRFLLLYVFSGLAGALVYYIFNSGALVVLIGASGAISGIMGAVFRLLFSAETPEQRWLLSQNPMLVPRLGLAQVMMDRRAIFAVGFWLVINLVFAFGWSGVITDGKIAWEAHLGGFFFGLILFGLFDPGPRVAPRAFIDPGA